MYYQLFLLINYSRFLQRSQQLHVALEKSVQMDLAQKELPAKIVVTMVTKIQHYCACAECQIRTSVSIDFLCARVLEQYCTLV